MSKDSLGDRMKKQYENRKRDTKTFAAPDIPLTVNVANGPVGARIIQNSGDYPGAIIVPRLPSGYRYEIVEASSNPTLLYLVATLVPEGEGY